MYAARNTLNRVRNRHLSFVRIWFKQYSTLFLWRLLPIISLYFNEWLFWNKLVSSEHLFEYFPAIRDSLTRAVERRLPPRMQVHYKCGETDFPGAERVCFEAIMDIGRPQPLNSARRSVLDLAARHLTTTPGFTLSEKYNS